MNTTVSAALERQVNLVTIAETDAPLTPHRTWALAFVNKLCSDPDIGL